MKKITLFLSILTVLFIVTGCGGEKQEKQVLYIYGWADYIPTEIYREFEEKTGIKIVEDIYSSNEEMFAKLKAGGDGYDIVMPSTDYVEIMLKNDMLEKLDKEKLTILDNIEGFVQDKFKVFDPNNEYQVPYLMSVTGIAVNKKYVKDLPQGYEIYDREDLKGRMTLLDDMREVLTPALAIHGYSQDTNSVEAMEKAKATVVGWKKNIAKFDAESFGKGFANEDFWVVQGYADNIFRELSEEQRENVEFIIPKVGTFAAIDSFVILKNSKNKENAYKFLEFIHSPEIFAKLTDILEIPSINVPAREFKKIEPIYDLEAIKDAQILIDINETLDLQNRYWQEILIAN